VHHLFFPASHTHWEIKNLDFCESAIFINIFKYPTVSAVGYPNNSLPLEGGGLGRGCLMKMFSGTLPLIPSPQGRGDFGIPRRLCGGEVH